jgi:Zn finger protein HypA/HybF involved in hydrogenase expression
MKVNNEILNVTQEKACNQKFLKLSVTKFSNISYFNKAAFHIQLNKAQIFCWFLIFILLI